MATAFERHIDMMKRFGIACLGLTETVCHDNILQHAISAILENIRVFNILSQTIVTTSRMA